MHPRPRAMDQDTPKGNPATWLPWADGLRATAAFLVFLHHVGFLSGATFNTRAGGVLARFGDIGVAVFFSLSGFLLGRPYVAAILDERPLPDMRAFYRRRLLRIVPA